MFGGEKELPYLGFIVGGTAGRVVRKLCWDGDQVAVQTGESKAHDLDHELHDASYAGLLGVRKIVKNIQCYFTCPNIWAATESYGKHCPSCHVNKGNNTKPPGLVQPDDYLVILAYGHLTISLDVMKLQLSTKNAVTVFADALTKYVILVPYSKESLGADWALKLGTPCSWCGQCT